MLKILVCNDDGVNSLLLKTLAKKLLKYGEVLVCAPSLNCSCSSQSIHWWNYRSENLRFLKEEDKIKYFTHDETPVDSFNLIKLFSDFKPDLVVSGINEGINVYQDIMYSATIGIAKEAIFSGVDAFSISIDKDYKLNDLNNLDKILDKIIYNKLYSKDYLLSVNIPKNAKDLKIIQTKTEPFLGLDLENKYLNLGYTTFTCLSLKFTDDKILDL